MRQLSEEEAEIVRGFYTEKNNGAFLYNHLWEKLDDEILEINRTANSVRLYYPNDSSDPPQRLVDLAIAKMEQIQRETLLVSSLLQLLQEEGFILTLLSTENAPAMERIEKGLMTRAPLTREFPDKAVNQLLIAYLDRKVFMTPELDDLVKHKFVPREERHFLETIRLTWAGIGVAIAIGVVSTAISIASLLRPASMSETDRLFLQTLETQLQQTIQNSPINSEAPHLEDFGKFVSKPIYVQIDRSPTDGNPRKK